MRAVLSAAGEIFAIVILISTVGFLAVYAVDEIQWRRVERRAGRRTHLR